MAHWSKSVHGATSEQKLFVDVEQTRIVVSSVANLVDSLEFDLKKAKASMETDLSEDWESTIDFVLNSSVGYGLTRFQVEDVLRQAGLSKENVLKAFDEDTSDSIASIRKTADSIRKTGQQTLNGINRLMEQDS
ncbi:hypothetical protein A200_05397 [Parascardovia denticolens IPLA 20019]|uniref:hypothetical protein n=1 Tax=Parascardovia denticolens TaxID=78258 RepID=UPI000266A3A8|nr:hypothetical protein [Parascardovia denticolens]EIT87985.1 hypothetical protein A200_05397 [Parascardovia denticolens IPLA 20019]